MEELKNVNTDALLQYMQEEGIIKMDEVLKDFEKMNDKKVLKEHKYEIYYSESEKSWRTYLPDDTHPEKDVRLKERAERTLKKKSFDFIKKGKKSKIGLI